MDKANLSHFQAWYKDYTLAYGDRQFNLNPDRSVFLRGEQLQDLLAAVFLGSDMVAMSLR